MPRSSATDRFTQRINENACIAINGVDGSAGNALSIPNSPSLNPTGPFTLEIEVFVRRAKDQILFDNSTLGVTNSFFLTMQSNLSLNIYTTIGGVARNIVGTTQKLKLRRKNFINLTYDGANLISLVNGEQWSSTIAATGAVGTNTGPLRIGAYYSGGLSITADVLLSRPRIYATSMTLAEHKDRYYRRITSEALQAALVLDLDTSKGQGPTVEDLSGNGNHATLGASASWSNFSFNSFRKPVRPFTKSVRLDGTTSYLVKTTPTGINTGTGSRWAMARIFLTGATNNALGCLIQFKRSGSSQSPGFLIGVLAGVYYFAFDTLNGTNNLTLTEAQFKAAFKMKRWLDVYFEITTTTCSIYVDRVLVKTQSWGVPINTGALTQLYWGKATIAADTDAYFLAALIKDRLVGNGTLTQQEIDDFSFKGTIPASAVSGWDDEEGTGNDTADRIGSNTLTGTSISWDNEVPSKARTASVQGVDAAQATASIQVLDYSLLDGVDSSATIEVTDYTLMTGGALDLLGFATFTEGVDFYAETSNTVTAENLANAINTAVEETVAVAVDGVITFNIPSDNEGGEIAWDGSGVTPTLAVLSGGEPKLKIQVGGSGITFGGDGGIDPGASNEDAATAIANWVNTTNGVFAVADGDTVNLTVDPAHAVGSAGNAYVLEITDNDDNPVDLTGIAVLSGPTFSGGADAVAGRSRA